MASGRGYYVEAVIDYVRQVIFELASVGPWLGVNAFVLAIAAGWVLVPGAVVGLFSLARTTELRCRVFAVFTVLLITGMLFEAALWGAKGQGVYERFTFYGAPLLAVAFVWAVEHTTPRRQAYAAVAYVGALAAVVLPVTDPLFAAMDDHSPAIDGISELTFGSEIGGGLWAPALALLAVGAAWRGIRNPHVVIVLSAAVCLFATVGESFVLVRATADRKVPPHVETPAGSAMLTWPGADPFLLLNTLLWNPDITRVVVVGRGGAPSTAVHHSSTRLVRNVDFNERRGRGQRAIRDRPRCGRGGQGTSTE